MIPAERTDALSNLEASAKELDRALFNLQPAQWTFKPTIDRWSIAECVDHLAVVEERVLNALKGRDRPAEPRGDPTLGSKRIGCHGS